VPARSSEEIRSAIEADRQQLGTAVEKLRVEVTELTDWRKQLRTHQREIVMGAAVAGFVIGGGVAGVLGLFRRRR
jgi:hypothetical protein